MLDDATRKSLEELLSFVEQNIPEQEDVRAWPEDTKMMDLPDDITQAEAKVLFATEFDVTVDKGKDICVQMEMPEKVFESIVESVRAMFASVVDIPQDTTIAEARKYAEITDLMSIGLMAHVLLNKFDIGVASRDDLLNGKGPFG